MDFVEMYYNQTYGNYPFATKDNKIKSQNLIDYLLDANIKDNEIIDFVTTTTKQDFLNHNMLPDSLWNESLLIRDTFYYHNSLQIRSEAPKWNPLTSKETLSKFYIEMKIKFNLDDLINYFYSSLRIDKILIDMNKDKGSFKYLLNKYKKFTFCEPIDFILELIDYANNNHDERVKTPLDLANNEEVVYTSFKRKAINAQINKQNVIVWRNEHD